MRFLVVAAHPDPESFSAALTRQAVDSLTRAGHTVELLDLYAVGFRAAMNEHEHRLYQTPDTPLTAWADADPMVAEHIRLVQQAEGLVIVYPTWWSAMPAILKGWLERVLLPGVGFVFNEKGKVRPGLRNIEHLIGITTFGSPKLYVRFVNDNGRRTVQRTLRIATSFRARFKWLALYSIDTSTPDDRAHFLDKVDRALSGLKAGR